MDNTKKQLKGIENRINKDILGEVEYSKIFTKEFMTRNSEFKTIEELLKCCHNNIDTNKDYERIPVEILDKVVKEKSKFNSWEEMKNKAAVEYTKKELNKIGIKTE